MVEKWDARMERFSKIPLLPREEEKLAEFPHIKIHKIALHLVGANIDIRVEKNYPDGKVEDFGTNTVFLQNFGLIKTNNDWWISHKGTLDTGEPFYYVMFVPQEFEIENMRLKVMNKEDTTRRLEEGVVQYMVPLEED